MSIRDSIVFAIMLLTAPIPLISPYFGVLMWTWIAYFNPHHYAWGLARYKLPIAGVIAAPTLVGTLFAPKNIRIFTRETSLLAALWFWFAFTTYYISTVPEFLGHVQDADLRLEEVSKILLMTFITIVLVTSRLKLRGLVLVILASFGLRAFFAALFYARTGGEFQIFGPDGTFLADNNDFALALNMTIPMFYYMARQEQKRWLRIALWVLLLSVIVSVVGTYSRGGLVGMAVITLAIVAKSRRKVLSFLLVSIALVCVVAFTTEGWHERMGNFLQGNLDSSAIARFIAWGGGWNLVMDYPLTGGGFEVYTDLGVFPQYVPPSLRAALYAKIHTLHSAHSIYFQVLGEQGFVGLTLFLMLLGCSLLSLRGLRRQARDNPDLEWVVPYTHMFEISLLAYMANGATLGRAYFDFFYQIIACVIILKIIALREVRSVTVPERRIEEVLEPVAV